MVILFYATKNRRNRRGELVVSHKEQEKQERGVYENGLAHRLSKADFNVQTQVPIRVCDEDGYVLGDYIVDMLVDGIVIELKAVSALQNVHIAQTINYLSAMKIDYGMLINFGSAKFESRKLARPRFPTSASPALCGNPPPTPPVSPVLCGQTLPTPPASPVLCGNHPPTPPASPALCGSNPPNPINRK